MTFAAGRAAVAAGADANGFCSPVWRPAAALGKTGHGVILLRMIRGFIKL
jgi:hypothetical protein